MSPRTESSELSWNEFIVSLAAIPVAVTTFVFSCGIVSVLAPRRAEGVRFAVDWPWTLQLMIPVGVSVLMMGVSLFWVSGRTRKVCWCANFLMTLVVGTAYANEWLHRDFVGKF